jgi:hypothetical protein
MKNVNHSRSKQTRSLRSRSAVGGFLVSSTHDGKSRLWSLKEDCERNFVNIKGPGRTLLSARTANALLAFPRQTSSTPTSNPEWIPYRGRSGPHAFGPNLRFLACACTSMSQPRRRGHRQTCWHPVRSSRLGPIHRFFRRRQHGSGHRDQGNSWPTGGLPTASTGHTSRAASFTLATRCDPGRIRAESPLLLRFCWMRGLPRSPSKQRSKKSE